MRSAAPSALRGGAAAGACAHLHVCAQVSVSVCVCVVEGVGVDSHATRARRKRELCRPPSARACRTWCVPATRLRGRLRDRGTGLRDRLLIKAHACSPRRICKPARPCTAHTLCFLGKLAARGTRGTRRWPHAHVRQPDLESAQWGHTSLPGRRRQAPPPGRLRPSLASLVTAQRPARPARRVPITARPAPGPGQRSARAKENPLLAQGAGGRSALPEAQAPTYGSDSPAAPSARASPSRACLRALGGLRAARGRFPPPPSPAGSVAPTEVTRLRTCNARPRPRPLRPCEHGCCSGGTSSAAVVGVSRRVGDLRDGLSRGSAPRMAPRRRTGGTRACAARGGAGLAASRGGCPQWTCTRSQGAANPSNPQPWILCSCRLRSMQACLLRSASARRRVARPL